MARINSVFRRLGWAAMAAAAGCATSRPLPRPVAPLTMGRSECETLIAAASVPPPSVTVAIADTVLDGDPRTDSTLLAGSVSQSLPGAGCTRDAASRSSDHAVDSLSHPPALLVQRISSFAGRDALDAGVDALLTRDPNTIAYAATRPGLASFALPWDRVYVLVIPVRGGRPMGRADDSLAVALRAALATDAVRAEARPVGPASQSHAGDGCDVAPTEPAAVSFQLAPQRRVVYSQSDSVSRALAERLVALGLAASAALPVVAPELTAPDGITRAAGLAPEALERALAAESEAAYILALPIGALPPCDRARSLMGGGMVSRGDAGATYPTVRVVPLIETRARVIVRSAVMTSLLDALYTLSAASSARGAP